MKMQLLGSSVGQEEEDQFLTSFLVDGSLAIDAGSLGLQAMEIQLAVTDVLLTHSHVDHLATLPVFLENRLGPERIEPLRVWANESVAAALQTDLFNGRLWPDFLHLEHGGVPIMDLRILTPEVPTQIGRHRVTAVRVDHPVATDGFFLETSEARVCIVGDTGPTERIWEFARVGRLDGVFLEASFPDDLQELAKLTGHLTPRLFAGELDKIGRDVAVIAFHIKARHRMQVEGELRALSRPTLRIGRSTEVYTFPWAPA
ncbi:MAG: 3',5'-cyclic-nucleotide phosphodiesterase [Planctomycetes bacterium]|nr:3',5'-cyclic-nucleotide phosphodiesterase [Planctomycetota bacterium]